MRKRNTLPLRAGDSSYGALPAGARADMLVGTAAHIEWLVRVVRGHKVWPAVDREGERQLRYADGAEMLKAGERLAKYVAEAPSEAAPPTDLSGLSDAQLRTMAAWMGEGDV